MKKIITITLLATLTLCLFAQAQTTDSTKNESKKYVKTLNLNIENGTVLSNGSTISDQLIDASYYNGVDLRLGFRKTNPKDTYSNIYRRPTLGVGYYSSTFRNPDIGTPTALYFFLEMPFAFAEQKKTNLLIYGSIWNIIQFHPLRFHKQPEQYTHWIIQKLLCTPWFFGTL